MISISFFLWQDPKEVPSPEKSIFLRKFNELKVDTFPCEKHSVRNSLNLFNIMIPNPITVSTIPEVIVILQEDGNLSMADWIKTMFGQIADLHMKDAKNHRVSAFVEPLVLDHLRQILPNRKEGDEVDNDDDPICEAQYEN